MPDLKAEKYTLHKSLPLPSVLFGDALMSNYVISIMIRKDIEDRYGFENLNEQYSLL